MKSLQELQAVRDELRMDMVIRHERHEAVHVVVSMGTCGIAAGARPVLSAFAGEAVKQKLYNVVVGQSGCTGSCENEPVVEITAPGKPKVTYVNMTAEKVVEVVQKHLIAGEAVKEYMAAGV